MSAAGDPVLTEVVRRLVEAYSPERIYLFGSVAKGEAGPDSDYDVMVIVPDDAPPERLRSRLAYRVLRGTGTAADVVVWPRSGLSGGHELPRRCQLLLRGRGCCSMACDRLEVPVLVSQ